MNVLVFGGTGFVGCRLVPLLVKGGHEVTVLTRNKASIEGITAVGARGVLGDLAVSTGEASLGSPDLTILLAAPRIFGKRLTDERFRDLKSEMTTMYAHAIDFARQRACPIVVTASTAWRTSGRQVADESWPVSPYGITRVGEEIGPMVARVVARGHPKVIWMLPGQIYGPGGMFMMLVEMARRGRGGYLGDGGNFIPRVHVDDCVTAYMRVVERLGSLATGERFIIADDVPSTARDFSNLLADLLKAPRPRTAPTLVGKMLLGRILFETATLDCRVSNAKARRTLDWIPRYPSYREGLVATVDAIDRGEVRP